MVLLTGQEIISDIMILSGKLSLCIRKGSHLEMSLCIDVPSFSALNNLSEYGFVKYHVVSDDDIRIHLFLPEGTQVQHLYPHLILPIKLLEQCVLRLTLIERDAPGLLVVNRNIANSIPMQKEHFGDILLHHLEAMGHVQYLQPEVILQLLLLISSLICQKLPGGALPKHFLPLSPLIFVYNLSDLPFRQLYINPRELLPINYFHLQFLRKLEVVSLSFLSNTPRINLIRRFFNIFAEKFIQNATITVRIVADIRLPPLTQLYLRHFTIFEIIKNI